MRADGVDPGLVGHGVVEAVVVVVDTDLLEDHLVPGSHELRFDLGAFSTHGPGGERHLVSLGSQAGDLVLQGFSLGVPEVVDRAAELLELALERLLRAEQTTARPGRWLGEPRRRRTCVCAGCGQLSLTLGDGPSLWDGLSCLSGSGVLGPPAPVPITQARRVRRVGIPARGRSVRSAHASPPVQGDDGDLRSARRSLAWTLRRRRDDALKEWRRAKRNRRVAGATTGFTSQVYRSDGSAPAPTVVSLNAASTCTSACPRQDPNLWPTA